MDEAIGITRVESDTGLIEDVEGAYEGASETCTEVDALALATRECIRETVQCQITKSHIQKELQTIVNLRQKTFPHFCLMGLKLQV